MGEDRYLIKDGEALHVCPYDSSHVVTEKRMVYHMSRCSKNHPDVKLSVCPFNAKHLFRPEEIRYHTANCHDSARLEHMLNYEQTSQSDMLKGYTDLPDYSQIVPSVPSDEDWDTELEESKRIIAARALENRMSNMATQITEASQQAALAKAKQLKNLMPQSQVSSSRHGYTSDDSTRSDESSTYATSADSRLDSTTSDVSARSVKPSLRSVPLAGVGRGMMVGVRQATPTPDVQKEVSMRAIGRGRAHSLHRRPNPVGRSSLSPESDASSTS